MSISLNTMASADIETGLAERLGRLRGSEVACCVPEYAGLSDEIRAGRAFPAALKRAKALADEHRLLAVALLKRRRELCACEIQAATGLNHATVSHHMGVLVEAGLVRPRREGKWLYYRLTERPEVRVP